MCFSYSVNFNADAMRSRIQLEDIMLPESGYFFSAFTYPFLPTIVNQNGHKTCIPKTWGLIPAWVKYETQAEELRKLGMNAKGETVDSKPMFRGAFKNGRCVIPAAGFFEWREFNKKKYPYYIYPADGSWFFFAGISDNWTNKQTGEEIDTYCIVTSPANGLLSMIHNTKLRMPLILEETDLDQWLAGDSEHALKLVKPYDENKMSAHTVSKLVSGPRSDRNVPEVQEKFLYPELETHSLF